MFSSGLQAETSSVTQIRTKNVLCRLFPGIKLMAQQKERDWTLNI